MDRTVTSDDVLEWLSYQKLDYHELLKDFLSHQFTPEELKSKSAEEIRETSENIKKFAEIVRARISLLLAIQDLASLEDLPDYYKRHLDS